MNYMQVTEIVINIAISLKIHRASFYLFLRKITKYEKKKKVSRRVSDSGKK